MNDSRYGLTASIWTTDEDAALAHRRRVETGTWFMNRCDYLDPALAWTGVKDSGRGCRFSVLGFEPFTRPKSFHLTYDVEMNIGLLQCDHVADEFQAIRGDYDAMFRRWLPAEWRVYDLTAGEVPQARAIATRGWPRDRGIRFTTTWRGSTGSPRWSGEIHRGSAAVSGSMFRPPDDGARAGRPCREERARVGRRGARIPHRPARAVDGPAARRDQRADELSGPGRGTAREGSGAGVQRALPGGDVPCRVDGRDSAGHPEFEPDYAAALLERRRDRIGAERTDAALRSLGNPTNSEELAKWASRWLGFGI